MKKTIATTISAFAIFFANQATALDLGTPIACSYGEDCFIANYYDHSIKKDIFLDHTCGKLSSDGHISTDFQLKNHAQMKEGVNVVAGDSGIIKFVRDGMSDISVNLIGETAVRGRECGNGVIIEHSRGYKTQYCHLKQNSITVEPGDEISKGDPIAQVGLSGVTSFPYLEFTVTINGTPVDPFTGEDPVTGEANVACDSLDIYPLWDKQTEKKLKYVSTALLGAGFSEKVPHSQGAREGKFGKKEIENNARLLTLWSDIFGAAKDDELKVSIIDPDGKTLTTETKKFTSDKRHVFQFIGKKPDNTLWPTGDYTGKIELLRKENNEIEHVIDNTVIVKIIDPEMVAEEGFEPPTNGL